MITGIRFDRGHGSAWGNQFYIEVCADEIVLARYFPEESQEQEVCEHIPITPEQWNEICLAIQALNLTKDRPSLWQKLWESKKLDGGEYRNLTLVWKTSKGEKEINYQWPSDQQANALEELLEQLVAASE